MIILKLKYLFAVIIVAYLFSTGKVLAEEKYKVAIFNFQNQGLSEELKYLEEAIPRMLVTYLVKTPELVLLERNKIDLILKEQSLSISGLTASSKNARLDKLLNADILIFGTIIKIHNSLRIDIRLIKVTTGKVIDTQSVEGTGEEELIKMVEKLSSKVLHSLIGQKKDFKSPDYNFKPGSYKNGILILKAYLSNKYHRIRSNGKIFLQIDIWSKKIKKDNQDNREPLNLSLVIVRSDSMGEGNRLVYAKQSAKFLIKNLDKNDYFSIVTYDSDIDVLIPAGPIVNKNFLLKQIDKIFHRKRTNLSGGLFKGYQMVSINRNKKYQVNRVLLISDGLANEGVTDPEELASISKKHWGKKISTSTIGVGINFDEKLLLKLAKAGNGRYYFIPNPESITKIIKNELQGLMKIIAQNISISIELSNGVKLNHLYGYEFEKKKNKIQMKTRDMFSDEHRVIIIELDLPDKKFKKGRGPPSQEEMIAKITLEYDDVIVKKSRQKIYKIVSIIYTDDKQLSDSNRNSIVLRNAFIRRCAEMMEKTIKLLETGKYEQAARMMKECCEASRDEAIRSLDQKLFDQTVMMRECAIVIEKFTKKTPGFWQDSLSEDLEFLKKQMHYHCYKMHQNITDE